MKKSNFPGEIDKIDLQILDMLTENRNNKDISKTLKIPLSTIQRRVRKLIEKGLVTSKNYIDFTKFGFKSGYIHIYLSDGNIDFILEKISKLNGINSLEVHIGNSDIIAEAVYRDGRDLLNVIANVKRIEGVQRIVWSERILEYPLKNNNISLLELETVT